MLANLENSAVATGQKKLFLFQSQRKVKLKNVQTTTQLHSFHTLAKKCSKFSKKDFSSNQEKKENLNRPNINTEIETVIKKSSNKQKAQDQMASQVN